MSKYYEMVGKKFGKLNVKSIGSEYNKKTKRNVYLAKCICDCGNNKTINASNIFNNRIKSCGCIPTGPKSGENNRLWKGYGDISGKIFSDIRVKAKSRNIQFRISIKQIWQLFLDQDRKCSLTGRDLYFGKNRQLTNASLDRIDSNIGYIKGNIQWVHKDINQLKNNLDQDKFIKLCKMVCEYDKKRYG